MAETQLNKMFSSQDLQRLRNIVSKKYNEKTTTGVGYSKKKDIYEEGDIWHEDGRDWTIRNGIKQNITKLDKAKAINLLPLFCPNCSHIMKGRNDKTFYNIHKMCFNCVVDFEAKLKKEGKWEAHLIKIHNDQIDSHIKEFQFFLDDELKESNNSFITEDGDIENWLGNNKSFLKEEVEKAIKHLKSLKK